MRFIVKILKKMSSIIGIKKDSLFSFDYLKQKEYMELLGTPKDDIERSFFQYKCQMQELGIVLKCLYNICSLVAILIFYIILRIESGNLNRKEHMCKEKSYAVFLSNGIKETFLPQKLKNKYNEIVDVGQYSQMFLSKDDLKYIAELFKRYPFSWYFQFKCMLKMGMYSSIIYNYNPLAIIASCEYSFTSSFLTFYLEKKCIEHIDIMHGERLYDMTSSFFRFTECYIWDRHYESIFKQCKAYNDQFVIDTPECLFFNNDENIKKCIDYTYYLGRESNDEILKIHDILLNMQNKGAKVAIRFHPLYGDHNFVKKICKDIIVEDPKDIDIKLSILRTKNVIALFSTVLFQAYNISIGAVINDVTNIQRYNVLKHLQYIMMEKKHKLLSEEIKRWNSKDLGRYEH